MKKNQIPANPHRTGVPTILPPLRAFWIRDFNRCGPLACVKSWLTADSSFFSMILLTINCFSAIDFIPAGNPGGDEFKSM